MRADVARVPDPMGRLRRTAPFIVIAFILAFPALEAVGALTPLNDLLALRAADDRARQAAAPLPARRRLAAQPGVLVGQEHQGVVLPAHRPAVRAR